MSRLCSLCHERPKEILLHLKDHHTNFYYGVVRPKLTGERPPEKLEQVIDRVIDEYGVTLERLSKR